MESGKKRFKGDWPFGLMDPAWMKDYYKAKEAMKSNDSISGLHTRKFEVSFSGKDFKHQSQF